MNDDNLRELLGVIDEPALPPPDAKARVWARVRNDLESVAVQDPTPGVRGEPASTVTSLFEPDPNDRPAHWRRFALVAAVVLLVVPLAWFAGRDEAIEIVTDPVPDATGSSVPTLSDPAAACRRFVLGAGPLADLENSVGSTDDGAEQLEIAAVGLDQLLHDFEANAATDPRVLKDIAEIAGGLRQAAAHLEAGEAREARDAFDFARRTYADSPLAGMDCLG